MVLQSLINEVATQTFKKRANHVLENFTPERGRDQEAILQIILFYDIIKQTNSCLYPFS